MESWDDRHVTGLPDRIANRTPVPRRTTNPDARQASGGVLPCGEDVRGAFNLAADPIVSGPVLAEVMGARLHELSPTAVRAGLATAWHLRDRRRSRRCLISSWHRLAGARSLRSGVEMYWSSLEPLDVGDGCVEEAVRQIR